MDSQARYSGRGLWERWLIATLIGLVVGMIAAIVFSYAVVNFFYPKETNLIVGLCMGAAVGLAPVIAARGFIALTGR